MNISQNTTIGELLRIASGEMEAAHGPCVGIVINQPNTGRVCYAQRSFTFTIAPEPLQPLNPSTGEVGLRAAADKLADSVGAFFFHSTDGNAKEMAAARTEYLDSRRLLNPSTL